MGGIGAALLGFAMLVGVGGAVGEFSFERRIATFQCDGYTVDVFYTPRGAAVYNEGWTRLQARNNGDGLFRYRELSLDLHHAGARAIRRGAGNAQATACGLMRPGRRTE